MAIFQSILNEASSAATELKKSLNPSTIKGNLERAANDKLADIIDKAVGKSKVGSSRITAGPQNSGNVENFEKYYTCQIYSTSGPKELGSSNSVSAKEATTAITLWLENEVSFESSSEWDQPFKDGPISDAGGTVGAVLKALRVAGVVPMTQAQLRKVWSGVGDFSIPMTFTLIAESNYELEIRRPLLQLLSLQAPSKPQNGAFILPPGPKMLPKNGASSITDFAIELAGTSAFALANGAQNALLAVGGAVATAGGQIVEKIAGLESGSLTESTNNFTSAQINDIRETVSFSNQKISDALSRNFYIQDQITIKIGNFLEFPSVYIESVSPAFNIVLGPDGRPVKCQVNISFSPLVTPLVQDYERIIL